MGSFYMRWNQRLVKRYNFLPNSITFYASELGIYEIYLIIFVLSFFDHLGTNHVIVVLQASNVLTECIGDQEHLTFKVDVQVTDTAEDKTYAPITANHKRCDSRILGMSVFNVKATHYANQYFQKNKFRELRGTKLVRELENKLQAKLGSTVSIPITTSGKPRSCRRFILEIFGNGCFIIIQKTQYYILSNSSHNFSIPNLICKTMYNTFFLVI